MNRLMTALFVAVFGLVIALPGAGSVGAEEYICSGNVGARSLDNVKVTSGKSCSLNGTIVKGNIVVERDAKLTAKRVTVNGSIQAEGASSVTVTGGRIVGEIQLKSGKSFKVTGANVGGSIQVDSNNGSSSIKSNVVGSDIQVFNHRGGVSISSNNVNGNLQCNDGEVLTRWAIAGEGLALRSAWEVSEDIKRGRLVPVLDDYAAPGNNIYAVFPERRLLPAKVRFFIDYLKKAFGDPPYWE